MKKTIFLIPGFPHSPSDECYAWMELYFDSIEFEVKKYDVPWQDQVQTADVKGFSEYYEQNKGEYNIVLGFSFGAMVAMISAVDLKLDELHICSLSYFKEDLHVVKQDDIDKVGAERIKDMKNFSGIEIAKAIDVPKVVLYGGQKELDDWPQYKIRFDQSAQLIRGVTKVIIKEAHHQIDHPNYIQAIKENIETIIK